MQVHPCANFNGKVYSVWIIFFTNKILRGMKTFYYRMPVINNILFLFIALVTEGCGIVLRNPAQVSSQL